MVIIRVLSGAAGTRADAFTVEYRHIQTHSPARLPPQTAPTCITVY